MPQVTVSHDISNTLVLWLSLPAIANANANANANILLSFAFVRGQPFCFPYWRSVVLQTERREQLLQSGIEGFQRRMNGW
jgi:hypothetical protein